MSIEVTWPLRPRHRLSPRARRLAAEAGDVGTSRPQPPPMVFAVAEIEVDLTGRGGEVVAYVAKAAMGAMPGAPVHLAVGPGAPVIRDAGDLSLTGLRRRLSEPGAHPGSRGATFTLAVSGLPSETLPPEPGQLGTLVIGATMERAAIVHPTGNHPAIAVRSFTRLTLAYDPKALERTAAVRILTTVKQRLETP